MKYYSKKKIVFSNPDEDISYVRDIKIIQDLDINIESDGSIALVDTLEMFTEDRTFF